jgi:predicted nucleic acid-binding protein
VSGPDAIVDTNIFVSARNPREAGHAACRAILEAIDSDRIQAIVSTVTLAELRAGFSPEMVPTVWRPLSAHLHSSPNYVVEAVDSDIAEAAGELRQSKPLTIPDAIIVATGQVRRAKCLVTQDLRLRRAGVGLPMKGPIEFLLGISGR